jgi:hypothetical protein
MSGREEKDLGIGVTITANKCISINDAIENIMQNLKVNRYLVLMFLVLFIFMRQDNKNVKHDTQ